MESGVIIMEDKKDNKVKDFDLTEDDSKTIVNIDLGEVDLEDLGLKDIELEDLTIEDLKNNVDLKKIGLKGIDPEDLELIDFEIEEHDVEFPEIGIESELFDMNIVLKKDYSNTFDVNLRKKEFIKDLFDFIGEFINTEELNDLMNAYDNDDVISLDE